MYPSRSALVVLSLGIVTVLSACSTSRGVDLETPTRLLGRENDVHLDAQLFGTELSSTAPLSITYEIENRRSEPIAIAEIVPITSYEPETATITVHLGTEVPGNELLPRLVIIHSGERRTFSIGTRLRVPAKTRPRPGYVRIRLNYLKEVEPFVQLTEMTERALHDPRLAESLFMPWVDHNQMVMTNSVPINWLSGLDRSDVPAPRRTPTRRTRGGM